MGAQEGTSLGVAAVRPFRMKLSFATSTPPTLLPPCTFHTTHCPNISPPRWGTRPPRGSETWPRCDAHSETACCPPRCVTLTRLSWGWRTRTAACGTSESMQAWGERAAHIACLGKMHPVEAGHAAPFGCL